MPLQASRWADPTPKSPTPTTTTPPQKEATAPPEPASTETLPLPVTEPVSIPAAFSESLPVESSTVYSTDEAPYDPSMDEFAQTREADDLFFDDDFTPVADPVVETTPPPTEPQALRSQHALANGPREVRGGLGGRGRGRGRGGRRGGLQASAHKEPTKEKETEDAAAPVAEGATETQTEEDAETKEEAKSKDPKTPHKEGAVRGDRSGTGGIKKAKLTEAELAERIASISLKNSRLTEAHNRAEADLASFEAREAIAAKNNAERRRQLQAQQKVDRQNRQQMMGEREKNRQRKLAAVQGREWDFEKEEGFGGTGEERRTGARRGAFGGVAPSTPRADGNAGTEDEPTESHVPSHRGRGRGRGGRGGRGRRGDHWNLSTQQQSEQQLPPSASDFPDLPAAAKDTPGESSQASGPKTLDFPIKGKANALKMSDPERPPPPNKQDSFGLSSPTAGKSWAEQVEGS